MSTKPFSPRKITSTFWIFLPGWPRQVQDFRADYGRWRQVQQQWQELKQRRADLANSREFLTFQIQEIEKAKIRPDEEEELGREQERLRHATQLCEAARSGYNRLYGDKDAILTGTSRSKKVSGTYSPL